MEELVIKDLSVSANGTPILNKLNLVIQKGENVALLGPNGHGKSTLLNILMGSPQYEITEGSITIDGEDLTKLSVDERARKGLFMAFQSPPEVPGVIASEFYRAGVNARRGEPVGAYGFRKELQEVCKKTGFNPDLVSRNLNAGFSGGERKRNEVLQMLLMKPKLAFLDEIDSGLDVDALSLVADVVKELRDQGTTFIIISHYDRLYKLINPGRTIVIVNGTVAVEGDGALAGRISSEGYGFLEKQYGINLKKTTRVPDMPECSIGAVNVNIGGA